MKMIAWEYTKPINIFLYPFLVYSKIHLFVTSIFIIYLSFQWVSPCVSAFIVYLSSFQRSSLPTDEREDIQKKTFAKWINSQLSKGGHPPVTDLFYDLRDGTRLLALLEVLTSQTYVSHDESQNESRNLSLLYMDCVFCVLCLKFNSYCTD